MSVWGMGKTKPQLLTKPLLSGGLSDHAQDRELEMNFVHLQDMEDNTKKLYKEVKRFEECVSALHKLEQKVSSDAVNSPLTASHPPLQELATGYQSVVYQMGGATADLCELCQRTTVEPLKKLSGEFGAVAAAIKKRDAVLRECQKCHSKYDKFSKAEKTGDNVVRAESSKRSLLSAKEDYEAQNRMLLLELPQFYERRVDYFQPCLQALVQAQVDYYGESTTLFTNLVPSSREGAVKTDAEYKDEVEKAVSEIRALSIVGN